MFGIEAPELLLIIIIILLLFGSKKLPELSKSIGESIKELRKGMSEDPHSKHKHDTSSEDHKKNT